MGVKRGQVVKERRWRLPGSWICSAILPFLAVSATLCQCKTGNI